MNMRIFKHFKHRPSSSHGILKTLCQEKTELVRIKTEIFLT